MKLEFEFARRQRTRPIWVLVFAIGLTVNAWLLYDYLRGLAEVRGLQLQLSEYQRRSSSKKVSSPEDQIALRERMTEAKRIADQLNLPWGVLFGELSALCDKDVVLLAVEPDSNSRAVRVSAEARNVDAMFAFLKRSSQSSVLKDLHLRQHHMVKEDPMRPIRFEVNAFW